MGDSEQEAGFPAAPTRESIIAAARKQVEKQRTYFKDQAEAHWTTERAQCRATAALLEISRIDDESLSQEALAEAREYRELPVNKVSNKGRGPRYGDRDLPDKLLNAPEVDQPTRDRVSYYTGQGKTRQRNIKAAAEEIQTQTVVLNSQSANRSISSSVSSSSKIMNKTRKFTKRPVESYWHHLEDENENGKKKEEVEDDPSRDPNTIIAELRKLEKNAADPNTIRLRVGRQYLRLVYGTTKTAAEVLADEVANGGGGGLNSGGSGVNVGDMPSSTRRYASNEFTSPQRTATEPMFTPKGHPPPMFTPKGPPPKSIEGNSSTEFQTPTKKQSNKGRLTPTSPKAVDFDIEGGASSPASASLTRGLSKKESFMESLNNDGGDAAMNKLEETFAAKQQRERREALKAIEMQHAAEARKYLSCAMEVSDPEAVVDRRVTTQDVAAEERKLRSMANNEKIQYLKQKKWNRAKLIVREREVQRIRVRSAAHELWLLEVHLSNPVQARDGMKFWLDSASGENERLAALQVLHESLSRHEKLVGDYFSANTHSLVGSMGELGDLHLSVLSQLREAFPREQHYLYALGRLESKRLGRHNQRQLLEAYVDASMGAVLDQRKENKSNGYYHRVAAGRGQKSVARVGKQEVVSHWQVDVREERQALETRDDFIKGAMPSDAHLNLQHQSAATTIHSLPEGGWDERVNPRTGVSQVGFRMEDTVTALAQGGTSQYMMEPAVLQNYRLKTRRDVTTSKATREHVVASSTSTDRRINSSASQPLTDRYHSDERTLPAYTQATGLSHGRVLEGVPTGLCMQDYNSYPMVTFTAVDGSAQRSMAAVRSATLPYRHSLLGGSEVTALPRRLDPRSCDFDVRNLYSTSS